MHCNAPLQILKQVLPSKTKDAYNVVYCKIPIKHIIDFLSLDMVVLLKEVLEGVEDEQNVINKSCRAYPLSL